jgi:hypothetical protein
VGGAGATVRKGQKASYVVFYKQVEVGCLWRGKLDSLKAGATKWRFRLNALRT